MKYSDEIKRDLEETKKMIREANRRLKNVPDGLLKISTGKRGTNYFKVCNGNTVYIKQDNIKTAKALANKQYCKNVVTKLKNREKLLEKFIEEEKFVDIEQYFESLHPKRQVLIDRLDVSDEDFAKVWQNQNYATNNFKPEDKKYRTENGFFVRSKTEQFIANKLWTKGIPFRYEMELLTKHGKIYYPDFVVLNKRTRQIYLLEHFGMIDNSEYLSRTLEKLNEYAESGYILGKNLLFTYETSSVPISYVQLESIIEQVFM